MAHMKINLQKETPSCGWPRPLANDTCKKYAAGPIMAQQRLLFIHCGSGWLSDTVPTQ